MQKIKNNILRCSNCGGSDIRFDEESGKLQCQHCRSLIDGVMANEIDDVSALQGKVISGGAKKIIDDKMMVTMKCSACGAAVTINTDEAPNARCPWCRHVLSITDKLPNGTIPDLILPFKVSRKQALEEMAAYISKHHSIAERGFINEFREDAIMGVYLPYMVIDMNVHAKMSGVGEIEVRRYTVGSGDDRETRYDADAYDVAREFDLMIDDLTIEASTDRLNQNTLVNTNNVINAIMPFDTENAIDWDPRYVRGYSCEHRDVDIDDLDRRVKLQVEDVMRFRMHGAIAQYNRGVRWDKMRLEQKGVKWKTAYLPVWLYSYLDVNKNGKSVLHYVAVNGRTKETVGSTPIAWPRVFLRVLGVPGILWFCNIFLALLASHGIKNEMITELFAALGALCVFWIPVASIVMAMKVSKFRNRGARHMHEQETRASIENVVSNDSFQKAYRGLSRSVMTGRNDNVVKGIIRGKKYGTLETTYSAGWSFGKVLLVIVAIIAMMYVMFAGVMIHAIQFRSDGLNTDSYKNQNPGIEVRIKSTNNSPKRSRSYQYR